MSLKLKAELPLMVAWLFYLRKENKAKDIIKYLKF